MDDRHIKQLAEWLSNNVDIEAGIPTIFDYDTQIRLEEELERDGEKEQLDEYRMEIQARYDNYIYGTEGRCASYGEIVYIDGLNEEELKEFEEELDEYERSKNGQ